MQVNWFTFAAQIVNFLILLWLLKHFLYTPLLNVMKNREDEVQSRLEQARLKLEDAENKSSMYQEKMDELEMKKNEWLDEAKNESEFARKEYMQAAREEVDVIREKWIRSVESEKRLFFETLEQQSVQKILVIVEHILKDLSGSDLEKQTIQRFLDKLSEKSNRNTIHRGVTGEGEKIEIVSSFIIQAQDRSKIDQKVQSTFPGGRNIVYRTDSELGFGIEIRTDGWKLGWNAKSYLKDMRSDLDHFLNQSLHSGESK